MRDKELEVIRRVADEANFAALDGHRRMGRSVPIVREGEIVWLGPDEIGEVLATRMTQRKAKDNK